MTKLPTHSLNEDGRLREGWVWMDRRHWPGLRVLWLWLKQGCPRDFPVIIKVGTITAVARSVARSVDVDGRPALRAKDITVRDWHFVHALLPMGGMHTEDLISGLFARHAATVTFPDGHQEMLKLIRDDGEGPTP